MLQTYFVIKKLYEDFPSDDRTVRLVMLCNIFFADVKGVPNDLSETGTSSLVEHVEKCEGKIEKLGLGPITRQDLLDVLTNKFAPDNFGGILEYGRTVVGLSAQDMDELRRATALASLEIGCKGRMLDRLVKLDPSLKNDIARHVLRNMRLDVEDLPPSEDEEACRRYEARLCRDFVHCGRYRSPVGNIGGLQRADTTDLNQAHQPMADGTTPDGGAANTPGPETAARNEALQDLDDSDGEDEPEAENDVEELVCLFVIVIFTDDIAEAHTLNVSQGHVGQDALTTMIRKDELAPSARRRRLYDMYTTYSDNMLKLTYPSGKCRFPVHSDG